jgi:hypothetical protein
MVRGTYLPLPNTSRAGQPGHSSDAVKRVVQHTSLGEEGAEAVIRVGRLALLGEITIGLEESA